MDIFWIKAKNLKSGKLGIAPHPIGFRRLKQELQSLDREGVDILISLLNEHEIWHAGLEKEEALARKLGVQFLNYPIPDLGTFPDTPGMVKFVDWLGQKIQTGHKVVIHCFGGIGRSGTLASSVLVRLGYTPYGAVTLVSKARGKQVPETKDQAYTIVSMMKENKNMKLSDVLAERYSSDLDTLITYQGRKKQFDRARAVVDHYHLEPQSIYEIYELEYKLFRLGQIKKREGWLPDVADRKFEMGKRKLNNLLKKQIERLHAIIVGWAISEEAQYIVDENIGWGYIKDKATKVYSERHPEVVNPKTGWALVDWYDPPKELLQVVGQILKEYFDEVWTTKEPYKTVEETIKKLRTPSNDIRENIHLFNRGLMTAHNNGKMLEYAFGGQNRQKGRKGTPQTRQYHGEYAFKGKKFLDDLTAGKFIDQWDKELPRIDPVLFSPQKSQPNLMLTSVMEQLPPAPHKFPTPDELVKFIGTIA